MKASVLGAVFATTLASVSGSALGAFLPIGTYTLSNHPDGSANPPAYGLRLDELYNLTGGHDIFTFDFNHALSSVTLNYTGATIQITGQAWGGRDLGASYAVEPTTGLYTFNFLYSIGVAPVPGDDDVYVNPIADMVNFGSITTPLSDVIGLVDKSNGSFTFRLGDENNDLGHRGFAGISGWGWLNHGPPGSAHINDSDWLFTATYLIPAPSASGLVALGALAAGRRRRA